MEIIGHNLALDKRRYWLILALMSLLVANVLAIFLVVLKVPHFSLEFAEPLFKGFLVYHVNLAMVYWMPLAACWLWLSVFQLKGRMPIIALQLTLISLSALILSLLGITSGISLSNYYPILRHPLFVFALLTQLVAVSLIAIQCIRQRKGIKVEHFLAWCAAVMWLGIVLSVLINFIKIPIGLERADLFELFLWAPGHIQQSVNSFLIASLWAFFLNDKRVSKSIIWASWITIVSIVGCLLMEILVADTQLLRHLYTWQMSVFSWLPMLVVAIKLIKEKVADIYLGFSVASAVLGVIAGFLIVPGSLSIPGHYHGMTGAFNLGVFAVLMIAKKSVSQYQAGITVIYGVGVMMLIVGLTWAGSLGIGRKLIAEQHGELTVNQWLAFGTGGLGAVIAISVSVLVILSFLPKLKLKKVET